MRSNNAFIRILPGAGALVALASIAVLASSLISLDWERRYSSEITVLLLVGEDSDGLVGISRIGA